MREDENGDACPETLGEYLDAVVLIAPRSRAAEHLKQRIADSPNGRDGIVVAPDAEVRAFLWPLLGEVVT